MKLIKLKKIIPRSILNNFLSEMKKIIKFLNYRKRMKIGYLKSHLIQLILFAIFVLYLVISVSIQLHFKLKFSSLHDDDSYQRIYTPIGHEFSGDGTVLLRLRSHCSCKKHEEIILTRHNQSGMLNVHLRNHRKNSLKKLYSLNQTEYDKMRFTCNLYSVLKRGKHQRVIGFSLFGRSRNYYYYNRLKTISKQISELYSGKWTSRVYYNSSINSSIICQVECLRNGHDGRRLLDNTDFCNVNDLYLNHKDLAENRTFNGDNIYPRMWRWFPLGDEFVDAFASRDIDSFVLQREVDSVNVWMASNKSGHIMRDHKDHDIEMMAGMWGFRASADRSLANRIFGLVTNLNLAKVYNQKENANDQDFLRSRVYGLIRNDSLVHDSHLCSKVTFQSKLSF
jgi:hypothetical protein